MDSYIQILIFVTIGVVLLWFGYLLIFGQWAEIRADARSKQKQPEPEKQFIKSSSAHHDPQICPVCSARLNKGELVKTRAFPSVTGSQVIIMHIQGCVYCLEGDRRRGCPVCGATLQDNEILIARMFERNYRRSHIHVLGCSRCKKAGKL
ncbi:MAG: hypothetical protein LBD48_05915 [Treponema sp.]|jgi:hypothetical protein|nr:hypothetical protein [Treponema sp.]